MRRRKRADLENGIYKRSGWKSMDYTEMIRALVGLLTAVLTIIVIPALRRYLEQRTDKETLEKWTQYVKIAVAAAEQLFDASQAAEKKQYVVQWLRGQGIVFDEAAVDSMIEAAVNELHQAIKAGGASCA